MNLFWIQSWILIEVKALLIICKKINLFSPNYIQKVTQLKNGDLIKMDKIRQKYLKNEIETNKLDSVIKK